MERIKHYFYLLPTVITALSSVAKLLALTQSPDEFPIAGLQEKLLPIAILELIVLVLYVIPKTHKAGFLLICSYFGGAIAVPYITGMTNPMGALIVLVLFWIAEYLREGEKFFKV